MYNTWSISAILILHFMKMISNTPVLLEENLLSGRQAMYDLIQICVAVRCTPL